MFQYYLFLNTDGNKKNALPTPMVIKNAMNNNAMYIVQDLHFSMII